MASSTLSVTSASIVSGGAFSSVFAIGAGLEEGQCIAGAFVAQEMIAIQPQVDARKVDRGLVDHGQAAVAVLWPGDVAGATGEERPRGRGIRSTLRGDERVAAE